MTEQESKDGINNDLKSLTTASFVNCNGLRYAIPYESTTGPICLKEKFIGQPLDQVLGAMFRLRQGKQPLEESSAHWRYEISAGRVEIRLPKKSRDDPWEWKTPSSLSEDNSNIVIKEKSTCVRLRKHMHEKVVQEIRVEVLSETKNWIVINKPGGLATIDEVGGTGVNSLMTMVHEQIAGSGGNIPKIKSLSPAHRLDKPVSGVLLIGKSPRNGAKLLREIQRAGSSGSEVKKVYVARVRRNPESVALVQADEIEGGCPNNEFPSEILVEAELGWCKVYKRSVVIKDEAEASQKQARAASQAGADRREARKEEFRSTRRKRKQSSDIVAEDTTANTAANKDNNNTSSRKEKDDAKIKTHTTRFQRLGDVQPDGTIFVECHPLTGQRHQIRAHLACIGWPIANDSLYGGGVVESTAKRLWAYADDERGTLRRVLGAPEVWRSWCNKCQWTMQMLGMEDRKEAAADCTDERGEKGPTLQEIEVLPGEIWLHSLRYVLPTIGLDVIAPLPEWALPAKEKLAHHLSKNE